MKWQETAPTERGWYWHLNRDNKSVQMHFVSNWPGRAYMCVQEDVGGWSIKRNFITCTRMGGMWCGPLTYPPIPQEESIS